MKSLFHIYDGEISGEGNVLLLEIGPDHFSYAVFDKERQSINALQYFSVDEFEMESELPSLVESISYKDFSQVWICSAYPCALLIPAGYNGESTALLDLLYEQPLQQYFKDEINEWQMVNAHSIPSGVTAILMRQFPAARFIHSHSTALKISTNDASEDQIAVHFTTQYFRVVVKKSSVVELAQMYSYKTPLDVVYYLLKICSELHLSQSATLILLSGLVEEASALYKELHNYFLNLHFTTYSPVSLPGHEYPNHFFNATYKLAACVS